MYKATIRHLFAAAALLAFGGSAASAEQRGVTDSEIRIGQTMPYSGPLSAYSALGKAEMAYFNLVNERGGINGRKIKLISLDDGYVPPRTVEQTRRLVESDEVALIFSPLVPRRTAPTQNICNPRTFLSFSWRQALRSLEIWCGFQTR